MKRYVSMCLILLMIFSLNMVVFAETIENEELEKYQVPSSENSTMSANPNLYEEEYLNEQMILPKGPGSDVQVEEVFLQNFATYYFLQLKSNFGLNHKGTCSYIAAAMLLSYYDTYWDDNVIPSQYDQIVDSFNINNPIESNLQSPGIKPEDEIIYQKKYDLGIPPDGELDDATYNSIVSNNASTYFHFKLLEIGRTQLNETYGMFPWDIEDLLVHYLYNERGYSPSAVTIERKGLDSQDDMKSYIIDKVTRGIPVIVCGGYWENGLQGHSFIIYDYDAISDELYCHTGIKNGKTHVKFSTIEYTTIGGVISLNFTNEHVCSNNYVGKYNKEYCSCFAPPDIHPAHECRYYKEYNETYHTYACDCNPSEENLFEHNFVYGNSQISYHEIYCSDCGYKKGTQPHDYQYVFENSEYHKRVCAICGHKHSQSSHNFVSTNIDNNYHAYVCADCGYTETKPHTFRYTSKNATQHTKICTDCGTSITENHNYEGKIIDAIEHSLECDCGATNGTQGHIWTSYGIGKVKCILCEFKRILAPGEVIGVIKGIKPGDETETE